MPRRQSETINLWLSKNSTDKFFYIARDHDEHTVLRPNMLVDVYLIFFD